MLLRRCKAWMHTNTRVGVVLLLGLALVLPLTVQAAPSPGSDDGGFGTPGTGTPTGGGGPDGEEPGNGSDPVTRFKAGEIPAERRKQLAWQAVQEGITVDQAIEKYAWQSPLAFLVNEIRQDYPDDFAGARIEKDLTAWIAFSGTAPAEATTSIRAFPRAVQIIENRGYTEAELERRLDAIHISVVDNEKVADVISTYDIASGRFEVSIELVDSVRSSEDRSAVLDIIRADLLPVGSVSNIGSGNDVDINVVGDILEGNDANVGGGVHISGCTTGFVIENSSGTRNITTAGHCRNNQTIRDNDFRTNIVLTFEDEHEGEWGDLQRHSVPSGHTLVNTIRWGHGRGQFRVITSTGVPMEGERLWKYGKSTGQTTDIVFRGSVRAKPRPFRAKARKLVAMENRRSRGGDSGGPWFDASEAHGVHMGYRAGLGLALWKERDLFTPVHHIDDAFPGWTVATSWD